MSERPEPARTTATFRRSVSRREAVEAFKRLEPLREGQAQVVRFGLGARLEHLVLILAVGGLALTGFVQTFARTSLARQILLALGGLEAAQRYHHLFGLVLLALGLYHALNLLDGLFVRREPAKMLPNLSDLGHFFQILKLNLGLSKKLPLFDRYSFDEKFVYWVTALAVGVLGLTGLVLWFPVWVTQVLPGSLYPYAAVFHRWQAILLVAVVLLLHIYQVLLRKLNFSIFTGRMSVAEMQTEHPLELAYLEQAAALAQSKTWPQALELSLEERTAQKVVVVIDETLDEAAHHPAADQNSVIPPISGESV